MNVILGQRVNAVKVFAWPDKATWVDGETVEFQPIDNPLKDEVAVVVGQEQKKYRAEVEYYCDGDGGATCGSEGYAVRNSPSKRTFIAIRYTLRGRRYFTTAEFLKEATA